MGLGRFEGHGSSVTAVAWWKDKAGTPHTVAGYWDGKIYAWNLRTREKRTLQGHPSYVATMALSADGQHALSDSYGNTAIYWWTLTMGQPVCRLRGHTDKGGCCCCVGRRWPPRPVRK